MNEPAPQGIIQSAEQPTEDLHAGISSKLNEAGHKATIQSVNPDDHSPLRGIQEMYGDSAHIAGSTLDEVMGGTNDTTNVRTARDKVPISIAVARALKRRLFNKAA